MSKQTEKQAEKNKSVVGDQDKGPWITSWNEASKSENKMPLNRKTKKPSRKYNLYQELSKRFVRQQDQTIGHRSVLMKWFAWITAIQLVFINVLIIVPVFWKTEMIITIFDFLRFFVGATFIELLGGLFIIVKYAFSHETYDMLKHLTYVQPKENVKE